MKHVKKALGVSLQEVRNTRDNTEVFQALLGHLEYMNLFYHTAHWLAIGRAYYGQHLLFQRLYEKIQEEIDAVGERGVVATNDDAVSRTAVIKHMWQMEKQAQGMGSTEYAIMLEQQLLAMLSQYGERVSEGTKALFDTMADAHETHLYLLERQAK